MALRASISLMFVAAAAAQQLPWYMQETSMTADGRLTFLQKPWWPRAQALKEGESFTLDLNHDGRPDTMIVRKDGNIVEAIDDTGRAADIWNQAGTAYLVSYRGTGLVDRMVVYIDNDNDGKADEMELRHYQDGYLRYAWFGENYDKDGAQIFDLKNWSYAGNNGKNKFRGNLQIYLNKYDPTTRTWIPLSECPFAFWDFDKDGHGDIVLRVSAAPLNSLSGPDADYANNYDYMWAPEATPLAQTGNLNVRFSFNIDPSPRPEPLTKPHYNFGFTAVGAVPYRYPNMTYTNPRRRPPQTVTRIDWNQGIQVGKDYPARETGFTWDESRSVWRWEGEFWIYERIYLSNTGGPTERWNMRREYSGKPAAHREIYYSAADKRYHLAGASEGWMEVGHLIDERKDLEFRWFDKDGDGYLDTIEVYRPDNQLPVRVSRFDPQARRAALDRNTLIDKYNRKVLPEAIAENRRLIEGLKKFASDATADAYEAEAAKAEMAERRRYCLDIARELRFLKVRDLLLQRLADSPYPGAAQDRQKYKSMEPGSAATGYSMGDTLRYWKFAKAIDAFTDAYAAGHLDEAGRLLAEMPH
jgi:hypothetical protein